MLTLPCRAAVGVLLLLALPFLLARPLSAQTPPAPDTAASRAAGPDLTLLKKALAPLASATPLRAHVVLKMTGSKTGLSFSFREELRVLAQRPGKFRADIKQFALDGSPQAVLLVISDGQKVWTYRAATHQYSVTAAKTFHAANNDMMATGLAVGGFFLGDGHDLALGLQNVTRANNPQVLTAFSKLGIDLTRHAEGIDGEDDYVYRLVMGQQKTTYRFVVNPSSGALRRVELRGEQNGVSMAFLETVSALGPARITPETFQFTPPRGSVKVGTLSVNPF